MVTRMCCFQWKTSFVRTSSTLTIDRSFNDLSNEIIFEIFDYFSWDEIQFSFATLNQRFDHLIESYPHRLNLLTANVYPVRICSLEINRSYQISIFSNFSPDQLSTLRSLSLSNVKVDDVRAILKSIPREQLEYIYLGICPTYGDPMGRKEVHSVQKEILSLGKHRLKHCYFTEICDQTIDDLPEILPSLRCLQLMKCLHFSVLSHYLSRTPNLTSLWTQILERTDELLVPNQCRLTRLLLRPYLYCSANDLKDFIRQCCPYLKILTIELYPFSSSQSSLLINRNQWKTILPTDLTRFYWKIIPTPNINPFEPFIQLTKSFFTEKLIFISHDQRVHVCLAMIDPFFIDTWTRS